MTMRRNDFTDFNAALRKACTELYRRTMATYQEILNHKDSLEDFEVEGENIPLLQLSCESPLFNEKLKANLGSPHTRRILCAFMMMMVALALFVSARNIHLYCGNESLED